MLTTKACSLGKEPKKALQEELHIFTKDSLKKLASVWKSGNMDLILSCLEQSILYKVLYSVPCITLYPNHI